MEIVERRDFFTKINGIFQYTNTVYFVLEDGILYHGTCKHRYHELRDRTQLENLQRIDREDRGPKIKGEWMIASGLGCYVKTASLVGYLEGPALETQILREVEACEILRKHPHRNVASYYGCREIRGRVAGLCFKRYVATLYQMVMPKGIIYMDKEEFRASGKQLVDNSIIASLDGILTGIRHLHSLGLVHNDINPANIMFDERGVPVVIDFDSCRRIGEPLRDTRAKRTIGWHDPEVDVALEKNDLDAFEELKTWLIGSEEDEFLFD